MDTLLKELDQYYQIIKGIENRSYVFKNEKLFPVEIHILKEIFINPEIGVMELAGNLAVTKGAASQKLKLLSKKGLLYSEKGRANRKKLYLTKKGRVIAEMHEGMAKDFYINITKMLSFIPDSDKQIFIDIISRISVFFKDYHDNSCIKEKSKECSLKY